MAEIEIEMPDTSKQEEEMTKLLPPSSRVTVLGREKNAAQLRGWCQICGDAAYNRNFGALSCDSCKAFFRRNVSRTPFGRCEGKCEITIESRTFCKKCRFNKCLSVGMKRHLVKGRGMKEKEEPVSCDSTNLPPDADSTSRRSSDADDSLLLEAEMAATLTDQEVTAMMEEELRSPFSEMMHAWQKTYGAYMYNDTSKPQMVEIMNLIEGPLKTLVSFAKNLPRFKSLPVEDQISLLKGCAAEAAIIRSSLSYDSSKNGWEVSAPGGKRVKVSADILKSDAQEVFQSVVRYYKGVQKVIQSDNVLVYFMITLSLFSSDREKLEKPEIVQETQQLYAAVLQSYCRIRHPAERNLTARVLMKTVDIRDVGSCAIKLFQSADNDQLRPLLHEIFDLPQPNEEGVTVKEEKKETPGGNTETPGSNTETAVGNTETTSTGQDPLTLKTEPARSFSSPCTSYTPSPPCTAPCTPEGRPESALRSTSLPSRSVAMETVEGRRGSIDSRGGQFGIVANGRPVSVAPQVDVDLTGLDPFDPGASHVSTYADQSATMQLGQDVTYPHKSRSHGDSKITGHNAFNNMDYLQQPTLKAGRYDDHLRNNSMQPRCQMSPPVVSPFQHSERSPSDSLSPMSPRTLNPTSESSLGQNVVFDFSVQKRGNNSQFGAGKS